MWFQRNNLSDGLSFRWFYSVFEKLTRLLSGVVLRNTSVKLLEFSSDWNSMQCSLVEVSVEVVEDIYKTNWFRNDRKYCINFQLFCRSVTLITSKTSPSRTNSFSFCILVHVVGELPMSRNSVNSVHRKLSLKKKRDNKQ